MATVRHLLLEAKPPWDDPALRRRIDKLSHQGWGGGDIAPHRALRTSPVQMREIAPAALLALGFFAGYLLLLEPLSRLWGALLDLGRGYVGLAGHVTWVRYDFYGLWRFSVPYLHFGSGLPGSGLWWSGALFTLALVVGSFLTPRRWLPLRYVLRLLAFFQIGAQIFFAFWPRAFPYEGGGYVHGMLIADLMLIALVPIVLGLTYYGLDFSLGRKVALTLMTMLHLILLVPLQYVAHAWIIHHLSLLFLPLMFFVVGLPLNVLVFIAFYSWGMSWRHGLRQDDPRWENGGNGHAIRRTNDA